MKTIVSGATGFVGQWLVKELLRQGDKVTIIVRDNAHIPTEWSGNVDIVSTNLKEMSSLTEKDFKDEAADIFFHFAWDGTSGDMRADINKQLQNVSAACSAVEIAKKLKCKRFINAGSIMEYEAMQYIPSDGAMPGMGNIYSTAKMTADFMAKTVAVKNGIEYVNVIISNIYGAGEKSARFLNSTIRKMLKNEPISLTHGNQLYDFIYASDAARAIVLVAKNGEKFSSYYIGNKKQYPLKAFVMEMKKILQSDSELEFGKIPFVGAELTYKEFNTLQLEKLGYTSKVTFEDGVKMTRNWILEEDK